MIGDSLSVMFLSRHLCLLRRAILVKHFHSVHAKTNIKKQARARRCSHKPWVSRHQQVFASDSGFRTDSYSIWRYPLFLCLKSAGSSHRNHIPLTEEGPAEGSVDATTCAQVRCAGAAVVDELKKVS